MSPDERAVQLIKVVLGVIVGIAMVWYLQAILEAIKGNCAVNNGTVGHLRLVN